MTKGIANMLKEQLVGLPFINKYGGLVYLQEKTDTLYDDDGATKKNVLTRFPVTSDYTITKEGDCNTAELIDFIPDEQYSGMIYFEDGGLDPLPRQGKLSRYSAKLSLIGWLNTRGIVKDSDNSSLNAAQISTAVFSAINEKLDELENSNVGNFLKLRVKLLKVLPQSKSIFAQYTYDIAATQYLMPPFEYFSYSLAVEFCINPNCIPELNKTVVTC